MARSFKEFVEKQKKPTKKRKKKVAVFTFGRMNPPTAGHKKVIDKVMHLGSEGDHIVFLSQTQDKKKNPLDWKTKVAFVKEMFPGIKVANAPEAKSPFQALEWLEKQGYTDVKVVVGSDRVEEFTTRMTPYAKDMFNSFEVVNAGSRDPDAEGVSGMSATKAREAAVAGDEAKFRAATGWHGDLATKLMRAVRKGMGVK